MRKIITVLACLLMSQLCFANANVQICEYALLLRADALSGVTNDVFKKLDIEPHSDVLLHTVAMQALDGTAEIFEGATIKALIFIPTIQDVTEDKFFGELTKKGITIHSKKSLDSETPAGPNRTLDIYAVGGRSFIFEMSGRTASLAEVMKLPNIVKGAIDFGDRTPRDFYADRELNLTLDEKLRVQRQFQWFDWDINTTPEDI